jgi:phosphoribosylglycinamide formyltransferase-1
VKRVAVFASGQGSNLGALIRAQATFSSYQVALVISNVPSSGALLLAQENAIETVSAPSRGFAREDHERVVLDAIAGRSIDLVCLAGYLRVLGPTFMGRFSGPILNIHPSLLPSFPGMHAQKQALEAGVRWSGATVHFVDAGLDTGAIILQEPVKVEPDDTEASLSARILETEHRLYPRAVDLVARHDYEIRGRTVYLRGIDATSRPERG